MALISISNFIISPNKISSGKTVEIECIITVRTDNPPIGVKVMYSVDSGLQITGKDSFNHSLNKEKNIINDKINILGTSTGGRKVHITICENSTTNCDSTNNLIFIESISIHDIFELTDSNEELIVSSKWAAYNFLKNNEFIYNKSTKVWEI